MRLFKLALGENKSVHYTTGRAILARERLVERLGDAIATQGLIEKVDKGVFN